MRVREAMGRCAEHVVRVADRHGIVHGDHCYLDDLLFPKNYDQSALPVIGNTKSQETLMTQ